MWRSNVDAQHDRGAWPSRRLRATWVWIQILGLDRASTASGLRVVLSGVPALLNLVLAAVIDRVWFSIEAALPVPIMSRWCS